VIVPPCSTSLEASPPAVVEAVRAAHARGARVASICSGAFVLAEAGLLDGRRATTHWMYASRLAERFPRITVDPAVLYVDEGDVLTSAGNAAGLDLCLHLVRLDLGAEVANLLARRQYVTSRTLIRRFRAATGSAPLQWLLVQRLQRARWLLESTDDPPGRIAEQCGLGTEANLRHHFARNVGLAPTEYRRTFRSTSDEAAVSA
jgi:transcriptional regulator GlxA family with amidase domain